MYEFKRESLAVLERAAKGLVDWQQPDLPEDLCLYRRDSTDPWLVLVAHESDAYLKLEESERDELLADVPDLVLSKEPSRDQME